MSFNAKQFITEIIRPALSECRLWSLGAEQLLAGTCAVESDFGAFIVQNKGPALSPFMMEPDTHDDLWRNFLNHNKELANRILIASKLTINTKSPKSMVSNLTYATLMCRIRYYVIQEALPPKDDIQAQAEYWKKYYNTPFGAGTVEKYLANWDKYVKLYYA